MPPLRIIIAWQMAVGGVFAKKESAHSHICAVHSFMGPLYPWVRLDGCCPHPDCFQNWEAFKKHLCSIVGTGLEMSYGCEDLEAE